MNKKNLIVILVFSVSTLSYSMQRTIILNNNQEEVITVKFHRPDSGFQGPHVIIREKITLQPEEWIMIPIKTAKNKPYSSIMCITPTKKFTLTVPDDVSEISIKNGSNSDT